LWLRNIFLGVNVCWQCGQPADALFCPSCHALQNPPGGYFQLLGLPVGLQLSTDDLQRRFYELSRQLHPDRFVRKTEHERQLSLDASSLLNDAYRTLCDPVKRAEYVLRQQGFDTGEQRSKDGPPELLEEVFDLKHGVGGDARRRRFGAPAAGPGRKNVRGNAW
jgi:molecular chaperone HscB